MKIFESVADAKAAKNKPGQKIETAMISYNE